MIAGRELDALVAEKVMGWAKATLHDEVSGYEQYWCSGKAAHVLVDSWTPSAFIHYAWQVVEKLAKEGDEHPACVQKGLPAFGDHATPFEVYKNYAGYPGWTCYFHDYEVCAHADTAPLAICKAALAACGVKYE